MVLMSMFLLDDNIQMGITLCSELELRLILYFWKGHNEHKMMVDSKIDFEVFEGILFLITTLP